MNGTANTEERYYEADIGAIGNEPLTNGDFLPQAFFPFDAEKKFNDFLHENEHVISEWEA